VHDQSSLPASEGLAQRSFKVTPALPARLLIDLPNWLGDLVMALPVTDRVVRANRGGTTILHVRHSTAGLVTAIFPKVEVIASTCGESPLWTIGRLRRLGARADIGLTMRNAGRAKILLRLSSRWSAGTASQGGRSLLSWAYKPDFSRHQLHDADALLTHLGLEGVDEQWRAPLPESLIVQGRRVLQDAGIDCNAYPVGLAPGVAQGGSAKRWPEEKFGRLAALLKNGGFDPVVIIGPGEVKIARSVAMASGIDLPVVAEDLDAEGLAAVLSNLSALVGNDSGPAHLASALGVKTVALFGPTDDRRTAPMRPEGLVMRHSLECAPCGQLKCPLAYNACLAELDPSDVYLAVVKQFEELRPDAVRLAGA